MFSLYHLKYSLSTFTFFQILIFPFHLNTFQLKTVMQTSKLNFCLFICQKKKRVFWQGGMYRCCSLLMTFKSTRVYMRMIQLFNNIIPNISNSALLCVFWFRSWPSSTWCKNQNQGLHFSPNCTWTANSECFPEECWKIIYILGTCKDSIQGNCWLEVFRAN